jgi:membrane protease YdiL (CAAX protease family)
LKELGLDWRKSSAWYIGFGILLGIFFKFPVFMSESNWFIDIYVGAQSVDITTLIQLILLIIPVAFSEEILFRAYFQSRLIERMGVAFGILATATLFRLLHNPILNSIPMVLFQLYQLAIWCLAGYLYYRNQSLYFVGSMHSTANVLRYLENIQ